VPFFCLLCSRDLSDDEDDEEEIPEEEFENIVVLVQPNPRDKKFEPRDRTGLPQMKAKAEFTSHINDELKDFSDGVGALAGCCPPTRLSCPWVLSQYSHCQGGAQAAHWQLLQDRCYEPRKSVWRGERASFSLLCTLVPQILSVFSLCEGYLICTSLAQLQSGRV
jgi:hypothetical protein